MPSPRAGGRWRWRRAFRSVRSRVLAAVLLAAALGLVLTGVVSTAVQYDVADDRVDASLEQEVAELRTLAAGPDPSTGGAWASVDVLLNQKISSDVADRNESALGVVLGGNSYVSGGRVPFRLDRSAGVDALVRDLGPGAGVVTRVVTTSAGPTRVSAVAVSVAPQDPTQPAEGVYVVGHALDPEYAQVRANARTFAVVALGSLLLVAAVGWFVIGRLLRSLDDLHTTAVATVAERLSERVPVRGDDDVADLARGFNAMLDRLEQSFEAQRQFLDDAGHELRTPLTIVQGHLELLDVTDERDVADTRDLVLDELARTARLVDDLTLLARARRPDFVTPRAVDAGRLLDETFDKVVPLGERTWRVDARADVEVAADPQRVQQALVQLVSNAVKFSAPGDVVALGSAVHEGGPGGGAELLLWVRDTGPGIAPEDVTRVFERFGRAATGRGVEGSGLGLSIVSAIAEAHGGRVELAALPGAGATFTLHLPLRTTPPEATGTTTTTTPREHSA